MKGYGGQLFKEWNHSAALEKKQVYEQWLRAGLELTILQNCVSPSASDTWMLGSQAYDFMAGSFSV